MDAPGYDTIWLAEQRVSLSSPIGTPEAVMLEQFQGVAEEGIPAFKPGRR